MKITIPIQNNVEVIIADVYIKCEISLLPMFPAKTVEGEIALKNLNVRLNALAHELGNKILKEMQPTP